MGINKKDHRLAIVIPAYKARFLRQALESIARQTDRRFTVYIGDDASPENIKEICDDFSDRLDLTYTRFDENLGHKSLVGHWNRCIEKSSEPWVWLFCDDDVMEPECVDMFYQTIAQKDHFRVLRFNTLTIDDEGEVTRINPPHPLTESGIQFIYHRLKGERPSFVTEYIFSREAYNENGGMVDFPIAWCSDDASWLTFAKDSKILTVQGANVLWRLGRYNISPPGTKYQTTRIEAAFNFVHWLDNYMKVHGQGNKYLTRDKMQELSRDWFLRQVANVRPITFANFSRFVGYVNRVTGKGRIFSCRFIIGLMH